MEKKIYVYENWSSETPQKLGTLFIDSIRGGEHFSFQFDTAFLADACASQMLVLDPDLSLVKGRQFPAAGKSTFGIFSDSSPDRWGRLLMERREKLNADKDDRKPNKLFDSDYLLGVYDESRMGALRFALEDGSAFLSNDKLTNGSINFSAPVLLSAAHAPKLPCRIPMAICGLRNFHHARTHQT